MNMKQKSKSRLKNRKFIAAFIICALIGTAAAAAFSNSLMGTLDLQADYPMELSWQNGGPWASSAFCDIPYTDTIIVNNLDVDNSYSCYLRINIEVPVGFDPADVTLVLRTSDTISWTMVDATHYTGYLTIGPTPAAGSQNVAFSWTFNMGAEMGPYQVTIFCELI